MLGWKKGQKSDLRIYILHTPYTDKLINRNVSHSSVKVYRKVKFS